MEHTVRFFRVTTSFRRCEHYHIEHIYIGPAHRVQDLIRHNPSACGRAGPEQDLANGKRIVAHIRQKILEDDLNSSSSSSSHDAGITATARHHQRDMVQMLASETITERQSHVTTVKGMCNDKIGESAIIMHDFTEVDGHLRTLKRERDEGARQQDRRSLPQARTKV